MTIKGIVVVALPITIGKVRAAKKDNIWWL